MLAKAVDIAFVAVGVAQLVLAPRIAEQRVRSYFSDAQVASEDRATRTRVVRFRVAAIALNVLVGGGIAVACTLALM